ncbi:MAG: ABC transporter permease [Lachnospiraceae bacterium]
MKTMLHNFNKYRYLLMELTKKGIKLKYRKSYLGVFWSMLEPFLTMIVLSYVFGTLLNNKDPLFPVFILSGRLIFTLYQNATREAMRSIRNNASMIKKVYVPKYMYPISAVLFNYFLFAVSLIVLLLVSIYFKVKPTWHIIEALVPLGTLLIFSVGTGLLLATLNVFFRDIEYLWNVFMMLVMYCCAIFYDPARLIGTKAEWVLKWNPLYAIIKNFRQTVVYGEGLYFRSTMYALGFSVIVLIIGLIVFYKKQDEFILYI